MKNCITSRAAVRSGIKGRRQLVSFMCFLACFCFLLSACGGTDAAEKKKGPEGFYMNDLYTGLEFKGEKVIFWTLDKESECDWTLADSVVTVNLEDGTETGFKYDEENDQLIWDDFGEATYSQTEDIVKYDQDNEALDEYDAEKATLKKVSEEEYRELQEKGKAIAAVIHGNSEGNKICFEERPDIETPDSIDPSVEFSMKSDNIYTYSLGSDKEKGLETITIYLTYLTNMGYSLEDVTEQVSQPGIAAVTMTKDGNLDGTLFFGMLDDLGLTLSITWY